jgi:hypothetical protein
MTRLCWYIGKMEDTKRIDAENWTFSGYKSSDLLVLIHLGAEPSGEDTRVLYLVTVLKNSEEEIFQLEYPSLPEAIDSINQRYHHWDFIDRSERQDGGGCGSCAAH